MGTTVAELDDPHRTLLAQQRAVGLHPVGDESSEERGQDVAVAACDAVDLVDTPVGRVISSPYVRCIQTVEPLAAAMGLVVESSDAFAEGMDLSLIHI